MTFIDLVRRLLDADSRETEQATDRPCLKFEALESRNLMAVATWTGAGPNNDFQTVQNWSPQSVPGAQNSAVFNLANATVSLSGTVASREAHFDKGTTAISVNDHSYKVSDLVTIGSQNQSAALNISGNDTTVGLRGVRNIRIGEGTGSSGVLTARNVAVTADSVVVGSTGAGTLQIRDGAKVSTTKKGVIGADATGIVDFGGFGITPTQWVHKGELEIGRNAAGTLNVDSLGIVDIDGTVRIGTGANGVGVLRKGDSGQITIRKETIVGDGGFGEIAVVDGPSGLTTNGLRVGRGGTGLINVKGFLGVESPDGDRARVVIGESGAADIDGHALIRDGGQVRSDTVVVGDKEDGSGEILVAGQGVDQLGGVIYSTWMIRKGERNRGADLIIGERGKGKVSVVDGGQVAVYGDVVVGNHGLAKESRLEVSGGSLGAQGMIQIGTEGTHKIVISDGGQLGSNGGLINGGTVTIRGDGSKWDAGVLDGRIDIRARRGSLIELDGGVITADTEFFGQLAGNGVMEGVTQNSGNVLPGGDGAIGELVLAGRYEQARNGMMTIDVNGNASSSDTIVVTGEASLKGALVVSIVGLETLAENDSFDIVRAETIAGQFRASETVLPTLTDPDLEMRVEYVTSASDVDVVRLVVVRRDGTSNQSPIAADDTATTAEDTFTSIDVLANDSDPEDDTLTITEVTAPTNGGTAEIIDGTSIKFTPNANYSGSDTFTYTIDDGNGNTDTASVTVTISASADAPSLNVSDSQGDEDTAIPLTISADLVDTDGSETLSITISGVPTGATLSAGTNNGGGSWALTPAQLSGLTITPPANSDGDFTLSVVARSTEAAGGTATTSASLGVTVNAVADAPSLSVSPASGNEDTAIPLSISASLADTDGSETLSITISGVPTGATLSAGTNNGGGSWTLTPAQLSGLTITPPPGDDSDFTLTVTAIATEAGNGDTASTQDTILVTVNPAAGTVDIVVSLISGNTTEGGGSATFTVVLASQPDSNVTVSIESDDLTEGTVDQSSLVFTTSNWSSPQTVTVTGVNDFVVDGNVVYNISVGPATSADLDYDGFDPADVTVTNQDDDVSSSSGSSMFFAAAASTGVPTDSEGDSTYSLVLGRGRAADQADPPKAKGHDHGGRRHGPKTASQAATDHAFEHRLNEILEDDTDEEWEGIISQMVGRARN